jgi:hypothetical protein
VTTPPEIIFSTLAFLVADPDVVAEDTVEACTSRMGAPRSIAPVANYCVYFFLIFANVD